MQNNQRSTFAILVSVFFFWGFVAASNDILIPVFKGAFDLENWQSQLINLAFYGAYFFGSILYNLIAHFKGKDLITIFGYQKSISLGLVLSALGTLLFIPAASLNSYALMLSGLFVVGLGFSLQQTAANPFAIQLGDPAKGSQRLSLAGGINNVGTTVAPLLISMAIFGTLDTDNAVTKTIEDVKIPYLLLGLAFIFAAAVFWFTAPRKSLHDDLVDTASFKEEEETLKLTTNPEKKSALNYLQLLLGMGAIFFYVGVEVATAGNLGEYLKQEFSYTDSTIGPFVALYWGSLMIGRWASSAGAFTDKQNTRILLKIILPYLAFGVFLFTSYLFGKDVSPFYNYVFVIPVLIIADFVTKEKPYSQLAVFSVLGIISLLIGIFGEGMTAIYGLMSVGLFCSTLWPCIFTLAISGLGKHSAQGSSYLVMMIIGGAIISTLQGALMDGWDVRFSFFIDVLCFVYLFVFALITGPIHKRNLAEAAKVKS
ncbi:MFS transporter, FHS family, L-fucose permease [Lishizhenia tianjinensis]|uniref:MFS transporter, FHS family, L-fucose permease n=1 Tax=Lishizhenia tianjinensis TaxID=477690 RepID=A0A1I6ZID0_9FLAO|nr:MFS transporter [Lishizhenia tianjinensis]SFT62426.1 MFS transporter, FHS family, L-fucose permease [Lishizhenia tianjinensis]